MFTCLRRAGLGLLLLALAPAGARAPDAHAAETVDGTDIIRAIGDSVLAVLRGEGLARQAREERVRAVYRDHFDHPAIAATVMGRPWLQASPAQRQEFLALFELFVAKLLLAKLADFSSGAFQVLFSEPDGSRIVVFSQIVDRKTRSHINVKWRLAKTGPTFKVLDLEVEGMSLVLNHQKQLRELYQQNGETVDGVIRALQQRIDELDRNKLAR